MTVRRFLIPLGLLLGATAAALSCADPSPVGIDARAPGLLASNLTPHAGGGDDSDDSDDGDDGDDNEDRPDSLLSCRPLRYDSVTQTIGPAGGAIEVRRNWLVVPRGALSAPVSITAVAPSDTLALVRLQPEGLRFQKTALLVATYDNCWVPKSATPRIALVSDGLDVIEYLASADSALRDTGFLKGRKGRHVVGELQHFSNYAVAW